MGDSIDFNEVRKQADSDSGNSHKYDDRDAQPVSSLYGTFCSTQPTSGELPVLNIGVFSTGCQYEKFPDESIEHKLASNENQSVAHIYQKAGEWTARFATGSGFVVGRKENRALIVSDGHVADDSDSLQVKMVDGKLYEAEVIARDKAKDLLLLAVDGVDPLLIKPVEIAPEPVKPNDKLIALGFPMHSETLYLSRGTMTGEIKRDQYRDSDGDPLPLLEGEVSDRPIYQSDMHVEGGDSGAPVFNERRQVVGVVDAGDSNKYNSSFSTPITKQDVEELIGKSEHLK